MAVLYVLTNPTVVSMPFMLSFLLVGCIDPRTPWFYTSMALYAASKTLLRAFLIVQCQLMLPSQMFERSYEYPPNVLSRTVPREEQGPRYAVALVAVKAVMQMPFLYFEVGAPTRVRHRFVGPSPAGPRVNEARRQEEACQWHVVRFQSGQCIRTADDTT